MYLQVSMPVFTGMVGKSYVKIKKTVPLYADLYYNR